MDVTDKVDVVELVEVGVDVRVKTGVLVTVEVGVEVEVEELVGFCPPPLVLDEGEVGLFFPGQPIIKNVIPIKSVKIQMLRFEIILPPGSVFEYWVWKTS